MAYLVDADVLYGYIDSTDWLHNYAVRFFEKFKDVKTSVVIVLELAVVTKIECQTTCLKFSKSWTNWV